MSKFITKIIKKMFLKIINFFFNKKKIIIIFLIFIICSYYQRIEISKKFNYSKVCLFSSQTNAMEYLKSDFYLRYVFIYNIILLVIFSLSNIKLKTNIQKEVEMIIKKIEEEDIGIINNPGEKIGEEFYKTK